MYVVNPEAVEGTRQASLVRQPLRGRDHHHLRVGFVLRDHAGDTSNVGNRDDDGALEVKSGLYTRVCHSLNLKHGLLGGGEHLEEEFLIVKVLLRTHTHIVHGLEGLQRVLAYCGLRIKQQAVGAIHDGRVDVGHLRPERERVVHHGVQELRSQDAGLGRMVAELYHALLNPRDLLDRKHCAEDPSWYHDGIGEV